MNPEQTREQFDAAVHELVEQLRRDPDGAHSFAIGFIASAVDVRYQWRTDEERVADVRKMLAALDLAQGGA